MQPSALDPARPKSPTAGRHPRLSAGAALLCVLATACGGGADEPAASGDAPPERSSVLLITLDTTRADALSCYAADGPHSGSYQASESATPHLDALARRGVRYTNASTVAPLTLPAHASMLTGRIPPAHGIRENGLWSLPAEAETLAETARAAGIRTGAFLAAVVLDRQYGLAQGFEVYDQPERAEAQTSTHYVERPANQVVDAALAWSATLEADAQSFTWVHLFDPHQPYAPPAPFAPATTGQDADASSAARYEGEVSFMDAQIGRLLEDLEARGRADDTLVLVVADHGESLGEHGEWSHAAYTFEATMRVPFLVAYPNGFQAGRVSDETISVVDVAPTVREALGLASGAAAATHEDGYSLWGRAVPADRSVYFESFSGHISFGWAPIVGRRQGAWKVIQSSQPLVFDIGADGHEANDLSASEVARLGDARAWLSETLREAELRAFRDASSAAAGVDAAALASLGYTGAGAGSGELPDPLRPGALLAPHTRADEYRDTLRASALQNEGQPESAQRLARRIVRDNPGNIVALQTLTTSLLTLQQYEAAVPHLERLVSERPTTAGFHYNLGVARAQAGRVDDAIASLWRSVQLELDNEIYLAELQRLLQQHGRRAEFDAFARRWNELKQAAEGAGR